MLITILLAFSIMVSTLKKAGQVLKKWVHFKPFQKQNRKTYGKLEIFAKLLFHFLTSNKNNNDELVSAVFTAPFILKAPKALCKPYPREGHSDHHRNAAIFGVEPGLQAVVWKTIATLHNTLGQEVKTLSHLQGKLGLQNVFILAGIRPELQVSTSAG